MIIIFDYLYKSLSFLGLIPQTINLTPNPSSSKNAFFPIVIEIFRQNDTLDRVDKIRNTKISLTDI